MCTAIMITNTGGRWKFRRWRVCFPLLLMCTSLFLGFVSRDFKITQTWRVRLLCRIP
ncbi:hypothetical protein BO83DRAFT_98077 [Aspergillus eucalypticola CBS 122712]|uniref:Uncharacterized protein n=1 Tax=Aspergillus eucalypticola (strain CBS 122712 / IBT 29274) TaxID=1448314 RepID=A0A317V1S2_ASPEC|nr:uncharacterized protein BO83DRAFT_98077 [Aspergillus eucalypticola CBS 122712]PWY67341.1 hypothetical protein BO83DRAFT_98077 [Aspergillus eucalypticola CBS 122712]